MTNAVSSDAAVEVAAAPVDAPWVPLPAEPKEMPNPYVGPRPFTKEEAALFFGRDHESSDLRTLVFVDRIVLFDAASGAGKSSLLNAALRQKLKEDHFDLVPADTAKAQSGRVRGSAAVEAPANVPNIFVYNLLTSIDEGRHTAGELATMTLKAYLDELPAPPPGPDRERVARVLIVDQFEEIFTSHLDRWEDRAGFFRQLREAVTPPKADNSGNGGGPLKPDIFVILAMRDDAAAMLDQYAHLLPGRLRTRFNMQRLDHEAALVAIQGPAANAGRPFAEGVAEALRDNLSLVDNPERRPEKYQAEFIEPVQLQVVCWQLWEELRSMPCGEAGDLPPAAGAAPVAPAKPCPITMEQLLAVAQKLTGEPDLGTFVDGALQRFYENVMSGSAGSLGLTEFELRSWVEDELITGQGTRNLVDQGETETAGLPNTAVEELKKRLLLHQEERGAVQFFELFHDRLVTPIKLSNAEWFKKQDVSLQKAREWKKFDSLGKGDEWLARSSGLKRVRSYVEAAQGAGQRVPPDLVTFLKASQEKEAAAKQGRNYVALLLGFLGLLLVLGVIWSRYVDSTNQKIAARADLAGLHAGQISDKQGVAANPAVEPQLSLLLAVEALDSIEVGGFEELLDQQFGGSKIAHARAALLGKLQSVLSETGGVPLRAGHAVTATAVLSSSVAVSPDGRWVAGLEAGAAPKLHIWDLRGNPPDEEPGSRPVDGATITTLALDGKGSGLFVGHDDGSVEHVSFSDRQPQALPGIKGQQPVTLLAASPSQGRWLALADGTTELALYPLNPEGAPGPVQPLPGHAGGVRSAVFSPNGAWLATVDGEDRLRLWDLRGVAGAAVDDARLGEAAGRIVAFSQDAQDPAWVAAAGPEANVVYLWRLPLSPGSAAYKIKFGAQTDAPVAALAFARPVDGPARYLVVSHTDGKIILWHLPTDQDREELAAALAAEEQVAAAGSAESTAGAPKTGAAGSGPIGEDDGSPPSDTGPIGQDDSSTQANAGPIGQDGESGATPAGVSAMDSYPDRWPPIVLTTPGRPLVAASGKWLLTASAGDPRLCRWDITELEQGKVYQSRVLEMPSEGQDTKPPASCTPMSGHEDPVTALYAAWIAKDGLPGWLSVDEHGIRYWQPPSAAEGQPAGDGKTLSSQLKEQACRRAGRALTPGELERFILASAPGDAQSTCERILGE